MKVHFSIWTFLIWLIAFINRSTKPMIFIFFLLSVHELAHCGVATLFKVNVDKITFTPFGVVANLSSLYELPLYKQLLIYLAGPSVHIFVPFFLEILAHQGLISPVFLLWCKAINQQILFFNLLPIFPLDGSGILRIVIHYFPFFSYHTRQEIIVSLCFCVFFFCFVLRKTFASTIVGTFLFLINMNRWIQLNKWCKQIQNKDRFNQREDKNISFEEFIMKIESQEKVFMI